MTYTWQDAMAEYEKDGTVKHIIIARCAAVRSVEIGDAYGSYKYARQVASLATKFSSDLRRSWVDSHI